MQHSLFHQGDYFGCLVFNYLLCASNSLDEIVLEDTDNNAVCSGLPHSVAFDGHLSHRNMHQIVRLLGSMEGILKLFIDHVLNISLCILRKDCALSK